MGNSKRELSFLTDTLSDLPKLLIKLASDYRLHHRKPKTKLDLQSQKMNSLLITMKIYLIIQSQESTPEFLPKKAKSIPFMA